MKRKVANPPDCPGWKRIRTGRFAALRIDEEDFIGPVSLLYIDEAENPLSVQNNGHEVPILNHGYSWLRQLPSAQEHVLTTMFDSDGQTLQWIIDICLTSGADSHGIHWWDDLYLDIAILPSGEVFVLDEDELDEALDAGAISKEYHSKAWQETNRLLDLIDKGRYDLMQKAVKHRRQLIPLLG